MSVQLAGFMLKKHEDTKLNNGFFHIWYMNYWWKIRFDSYNWYRFWLNVHQLHLILSPWTGKFIRIDEDLLMWNNENRKLWSKFKVMVVVQKKVCNKVAFKGSSDDPGSINDIFDRVFRFSLMSKQLVVWRQNFPKFRLVLLIICEITSRSGTEDRENRCLFEGRPLMDHHPWLSLIHGTPYENHFNNMA